MKYLKLIVRFFLRKERVFVEEDIFKTIISLSDKASDKVTDKASDKVDERAKRILIYCKSPKSREEIQEYIKMKHKSYFLKNILIL
jgi:ATP-dependent DNA helicase RecG